MTPFENLPAAVEQFQELATGTPAMEALITASAVPVLVNGFAYVRDNWDSASEVLREWGLSAAGTVAQHDFMGKRAEALAFIEQKEGG